MKKHKEELALFVVVGVSLLIAIVLLFINYIGE